MVEPISETTLVIAIFFGVMIIFYLIVREIRLMRTGTRKLELEVEKEKLDLIRQDMKPSEHPFARLSSEQLLPLQTLETELTGLSNEVFAKERLVEGRLMRLEKNVKKGKLDRMLGKIETEEKRLGDR